MSQFILFVGIICSLASMIIGGILLTHNAEYMTKAHILSEIECKKENGTLVMRPSEGTICISNSSIIMRK